MRKFFLHSAGKFTVVYYTMSKTLIKSICFTGIAMASFAASCQLKEEKTRGLETWHKKVDSTGNAMLDSIYKMESWRCDSIKIKALSRIVDSMLKADTTKHK